MRLSATLLALLTAVSLAACGGGSNSSSTTTSTDASASAAPAASAAANSGSTAASTDDIPDYPGASKLASAGSGGAAGTVETTADPVSKVADFYKGKLGADAKMTSVNGPTGESTVFTMGDVSSGTYSTVTISSMGGKTNIAIAKVKKQ